MALLGRNASVTVNSNTVVDLYNWQIDLVADPITQPVFGDTWSKTHGLAVNSWSGSFEGIFATTDTNGQVYLRNAQINSTVVSGIKFYLDATNYYAPDVVADSDAGVYITSHSVTVDPQDVVRVTYEFTGSGELDIFTT